MKQRRTFLLAAASAALATPGCTLMGGLAQYGRIGEARKALLDYLDDGEVASIRVDMSYLDGLYTAVNSILGNDPDISLIDVVMIVLGAPAEFKQVGVRYGVIYDVVLAHHRRTGEPIPPVLVAFDQGVRPAYKDLETAVMASDRTVKAVAMMQAFRPIVLLLI